MRTALVLVQTLTFFGLAGVMVLTGELRFALAQFLLGLVTIAVYL